MLNIKIISILLCLLFLSCSNDADYGFNPHPTLFHNSLNFKGSKETLDIITWNIENFPNTNTSNQYVLEIIDSLNVDIIALQEIVGVNEFENLVNSLSSTNWVGFRSGVDFGNYEDNYQELAYLINTETINILSDPPYIILETYEYEFAYREPYVLEFMFDQELMILINVHYKCCDGSEERRLASSQLLYDHINNNYNNSKVLVVGDFNDLLIDNFNVVAPFLNDNDNYLFADYSIAKGNFDYWSYPSWPSHLDHILITDELFNSVVVTQTILLGHSEYTNAGVYENNVSDHRPVGIKLNP